MEDKSFKLTLIKVLENKANSDLIFGNDLLWSVILTLPICNLFLEETSLFTRSEWNTYITVLHIQVPLDKQSVFEATSVASSIGSTPADAINYQFMSENAEEHAKGLS